jgi:transposase
MQSNMVSPAWITVTPVAMLLSLKGIGADFATVLSSEGLCREFSNRRQVAAYAGLAATPWRSVGRIRAVGEPGSGQAMGVAGMS